VVGYNGLNDTTAVDARYRGNTWEQCSYAWRQYHQPSTPFYREYIWCFFFFALTMDALLRAMRQDVAYGLGPHRFGTSSMLPKRRPWANQTGGSALIIVRCKEDEREDPDTRQGRKHLVEIPWDASEYRLGPTPCVWTKVDSVRLEGCQGVVIRLSVSESDFRRLDDWRWSHI
jgi:hypothetical protein